ncbi:MAG TPA: AraC family transcriptional regulator [Povalibacter sp.]
MADRLEALLNHYTVTAQMFHSGPLCGINELPAQGDLGQLHLIKEGPIEVSHAGHASIQISEPSLLFYPRPLTHRFRSDPQRGADMACANLKFSGGMTNPIAAALPACICLPLAKVHGVQSILAVLFEEAFNQRCGRRAMVDRLFEVVLIQLLRHLMEAGEIRGGMLAGLAHPKLRHALIAMHEKPADEWSLESLADASGMSRSTFADSFRDTLGCTPGIYLQSWRVSLAQQALRRGRSLKMIAVEVGYGSEAALSRAFKAQSGVTPSEWRRGQDSAALS